MPATESQVLDALRNVMDPDLHRDIVTLGFVKNIKIEGADVSFVVELTTPACPVKDQLKAQCEEEVAKLKDVLSVSVEMTAAVRPRPPAPQDILPGVKHCVAIASGKGGVGKSTVTVNLAIALAQEGAKVGVLDADVYGPSVPLMMGVTDRPFTKDGKLIPVFRYGVHMMSLGFLLEEGQSVLWRGPMVASTVKQLLNDVDWGELDYLLVDLPPGTGDAPMTLAQSAPLSGVVIVATPQHVAANIAGKAAALFRRLNTPVLGVVENMADYICPSCGNVSRIFSGMPGEKLAAELLTPYLGSIPLDPAISASSDDGLPSLIAMPDGAQADAFRQLAGKLAQQLSIRAMVQKEVFGEQTASFQPIGQE